MEIPSITKTLLRNLLNCLPIVCLLIPQSITPNLTLDISKRQLDNNRPDLDPASLIRINHRATSSSAFVASKFGVDRFVWLNEGMNSPLLVSWLTFCRDIAETRCSNNGYERKREESFNRPSGNVKRMQQRTTNSCDDFGGRTLESRAQPKFPGQLRERIVRTSMAANMVKFWVFVCLCEC